ncbi:MAG TPA: FAD-dependent oxidoreductase [Terriglobales bacterium]|nr:FAD-dependent oxidoreductase [Terriglobales bacterium]
MSFTRRDFLYGVGQAAGYSAVFATMQALGLLPPAAPSASKADLPSASGKGVKVAILGAGIAGMVAAYEMGKAGYECTVLEARERPGGRNWTLRRGTSVKFLDGAAQSCEFDEGHYLNAGPARIPSIHKTMLGYCQELEVPLEVEVNCSRSSLLQNSKAFDGKPMEQREAVNDTRGHVSELLAKAVKQNLLGGELAPEDTEKMIEFLRFYGPLDADLIYKGSNRAGVSQLPGAGPQEETLRQPLPMHALLDASFWQGMMFSEILDMQATMFEPAGGMDRIAYAFARKLSGVIQYSSPVTEIRRAATGVRILYANANGPHVLEADYCICALPLTILKKIPNDFSPEVQTAIAEVTYDSAYKIAWESPRFWETERNIYGGLSFLVNDPISVVWYPSCGLFSERGVVVAGYSVEKGTDFAKLPTLEAKIAASRNAMEKLHPGFAQQLEKPIYVSWGQIPWNEGSWISRGKFGEYDDPNSPFYTGPYQQITKPDGPFIFAGDHAARVGAWQEGAALSAHRAAELISAQVRARRA